ncbi:hypothetical protein LJ655_25260 [Paraburkholderia sp. MMS20-SJTN17]|uniref:Uncharacterized protein n=1 Tax=Paraburkholderia translucens TaxID=2886945 RepID=A0ABS8KK45_9BURK|nr:hypothetical protein [Paraburkholderia sp. MMS20-SJTN17]MCC8405146.1 hypothetical protein [Paraburkholderia sp. MMS20-SJTN17]
MIEEIGQALCRKRGADAARTCQNGFGQKEHANRDSRVIRSTDAQQYDAARAVKDGQHDADKDSSTHNGFMGQPQPGRTDGANREQHRDEVPTRSSPEEKL